MDQSSCCARSRICLPLSVRSGLPPLPTMCSKKMGFHSSLLCSRRRAFSRCFSSSSTLISVALEYCLAWMALVTPPQRVSDSLGSCLSSGGRILGATLRGVMSIIICCSSAGTYF